MDKYHCNFEILTDAYDGGRANWVLIDHKGSSVATGPGYKNWHNANRALLRHIKVIQSGNFILPPKPLRKPYTLKSHVPKN